MQFKLSPMLACWGYDLELLVLLMLLWLLLSLLL
jgi:hypothetical protein